MTLPELMYVRTSDRRRATRASLIAAIETMPLPPTFTPLRKATYVIDAEFGDRSGLGRFLHHGLQIALQRILVRGPQYPVRRHQAFGAGLAQCHFETLRVRMVAQLISQQGLSLRLPFRRRREVLSLLNHQPAPVHHLLP